MMQFIIFATHSTESVLDSGTFKRRLAHEQRVEQTPERPDICLEAIGLATDDFGGDVVGSATEGLPLLVLIVQLDGQSEICDFLGFESNAYNVSIIPEEHVAQLEVAVHDTQRVEVAHALHDFFKILDGFALVEASARFDVVVELAVAAQLEHDVDLEVVFEDGLEREHVGVAEGLVDLSE